jgi:hypothetical protein
MNYKLEFVKIGNEFKFAGVGFAGNIFIVLNALTHIPENSKLFVDMEKNECVCTEKNTTIFNTNNCWEYYFDQIKINNSEEYIILDSLIPANIHYENRSMFLYPKNFNHIKNKFYNSFQLKKELKDLLDIYYNEKIKDKVTLGVQIRLTDMKHHHNVSSVDLYITKIKEILNERPEIQQIFLATDDNRVFSNVKSNISIPVIWYEDMFRADNSNPHLNPYDRYNSDRDLHKYKLGVECIQEIFTLAKCDYLLKADKSAVSIVACILAENIKQVYML